MMAPTSTSMTMMTKTNNLECCMCGDLGLSHLLFRCAVCHFRSQHRYCSNLYPKAESYKVCNWCLINKDNVDNDQHKNLNLPSLKNNSDNNKKLKRAANNNPPSGPGPKCLRPTSPIKKAAIRSPPVQSRSPSGRKTITASNNARARDHQEVVKIGSSSKLNRTKSTSSFNIKTSKKNTIDDNNNKKSESGREANGGGPIPVIKHVFRNKVRRYKLLAEVSC